MNKNHFIVKTIFTREECDEILRMKTKMVRRQELVSEFDQKKSTFLNNNFRSNTLITEDDSGEQMKTKSVGRITMGSEFESSWINGNQTNYNDTVIEADSWVYDRLMENMDIGSYATCDGLWPLHLKEYEVDDEIGMHFDDVRGIRRVAVSISLNDDYEGGELQIFNWHYSWDGKDERGESGWITVDQKIGMMTLIPVIIPHRVTIVKGVRSQLTSWFLGDKLNW